jgi:hypothetical protein
MVNGDEATGVDVVYELVQTGALESFVLKEAPLNTGVTTGPVGEPE